jgi:hypothetical protein
MSHPFRNWIAPCSTAKQSPKCAGRKPRSRPQLELLETRDVPSTAVAHPTFVLMNPAGVHPFAGGGPTGYTPAQIKQAYGINQISFNGAAGDGSNTTIAIVDAYDDVTIASDLQVFDSTLGLPNPAFSKINQNGGTSLPRGDSGWAEETSLDVEWAHAIAPKAAILLVEANSASFSDLLTAVQTAANHSGVVAVSMSWGGGEFSGETSYDSYFKSPSGRGVTFLASSGDSGAPVSYPAVSPNVVSVGGTTLSLDSSGNITNEAGWSGSGGGISSQESQPSYQHGVVTQSSTKRTNPDVAYDADPNTGFPVYDSYSFPTAPWQQFGGTSDAAPQWAALIAIADQGRALAGLGSLDSVSQTLPKLYSVSAADFHDITSGSSYGVPVYSAGAGYDLVTGRGTPVANKLVADLVGSSNSGTTHFSVTTTASSSDTAGTTFSVTVKALDANGNVYTGYLGTVQFSSSDPAAVLPGNYTFNSTDAGVHTFSTSNGPGATLKTAGSRTVTVADVSAGGINGSASVNVVPATASALAFVQQPTGTTAGSVITPAVTVDVVDAYGNLETADNTDSVTVAFGANPGNATLGGTTTVTVSGGVATFNNLTVSAAGNGYTLQATSGSLTTATSASFNISSSGGGGGGGTLLEGFETSDNWYYTGYGNDTAYLTTAAAHDGTWGLDLTGPDWFYRTDAGAQNKAGDTLSAWVQFSGAANGRAYFGFGSSGGGTLSLVAAANSNQLILMNNVGWGYTNLAAVNATYQANHWYRLEVDWSTTGNMVGKLFDSNGTTLLRSVSASTKVITSGGIALRSIGNDKYWDTITDTSGVNNFARRAVTTHATTPPWWQNSDVAGTLSGITSAKSAAAALESAVAEYLAALANQRWSHAYAGWLGWGW